MGFNFGPVLKVQTSKGQRPWRGPRGSAPGGGPADRSAGRGQGGSAPCGGSGAEPPEQK